MEKFYSLLNRLNGEDDVVSFVDKRKIICEEENETHYKGSYWSKGRKICLNKVREGVSLGGCTSSSSEFLLDNRLIVIDSGLDGSFLSVGNLDMEYQVLFRALKRDSDSINDIDDLAHFVSSFSDFYFGKDWDSERRNELLLFHDIVTLSMFRKKSIAKCVERATLCHNVFKILGIDATLKSSMIEFNGETSCHFYNIIRVDGKNYIFDTSIPNRNDEGEKMPIVGTLSDDEYMLMVYGRSYSGCRTDTMSNGVVYDSSFKPVHEMLNDMPLELINEIRERSLIDNPQDSNGIELTFSDNVSDGNDKINKVK